METTLYRVSFMDGRVFKVFCRNRKQKIRMMRTEPLIKENGGKIDVLESGIHDIKQWEDIISIKK